MPDLIRTAALYYPSNHTLEVFGVDDDGALKDVWKVDNGLWQPRVALTGGDFAPAGVPVTGAYYAPANTLEAFLVDKFGHLHGMWKAPHVQHQWQPAFALAGPSLGGPGAHLAAVSYAAAETLELFLVEPGGRVRGVWKAPHVGHRWQPPFDLPGSPVAAAGAPLAAVHYPVADTLEVFVVGDDEMVRGYWKAPHVQHQWQAPFHLPGGAFAPSAAHVAAVYHPPGATLEVFVVGHDGAVHGFWKAPHVGHSWQPRFALTPTGFAPPGAPLAVAFHPPTGTLELFVCGRDRRVWVVWKGPGQSWSQAPLTDPDRVTPGAPVSAAHYPIGEQLEVFVGDERVFSRVLWKQGPHKWRPCAVPIAPRAGVADLPDAKTERIAQVTGTAAFASHGAPGADLGASTMHDGSLFVFLGDIAFKKGDPRRDPPAGPVYDADCVARAISLTSTNLTLEPIVKPRERYFAPFTMRRPSGALLTPRTNQTPTGAFSAGGFAYVFVLLFDGNLESTPNVSPFPVASYLTRTANPANGEPYDELFRLSENKFWQVAPWRVLERRGLTGDFGVASGDEPDADGVVLLGGGFTFDGRDGVHLAWMPLGSPVSELRSRMRFYTGDPAQPWSSDEAAARPLWYLPGGYSSVSLIWVEGADRWVTLYCKGFLDIQNGVVKVDRPRGPVVARVAETPIGPWSREIVVFDPCRDHAHGVYMHWPCLDTLNTNGYPDDSVASWAYGAFIIAPLTKWNAAQQTITLHYLLSTSRPYQVQFMRSTFSPE